MTPTLSEHELCVGIRSPRVLARLLRSEAISPTPENTPRSPVRPIFTTVLRDYFRSGREPEGARANFVERVAKSKRREKLATQFAKGLQMLEVFLMWDSTEPTPEAYFIPPQPADVAGWSVRLGHDLLYPAPEGKKLRQVLTDSAIVRAEHLRLFAVASLLHFERLNPNIKLAIVEVWSVRAQKRFTWPGGLLLGLVPELSERLSLVAGELGNDAA
jgi:hypothetical protein